MKPPQQLCAEDRCDPAIFERLFQLFTKELAVLNNPVCASCDAQLKGALLPWHVGVEFRRSHHRLLIVGKPHRGTRDEEQLQGCLDGRKDGLELFFESSWPYWSYSRDILRRVYGEERAGWRQIVFTNIVKCTNVEHGGNSADRTSELMARSCIVDLGVIKREIELLQPRTILFYTYSLYRELLRDLKIEAGCEWRDVTASDYSVRCGAKQLGWWQRTCRTSWDEQVRVLITGHPERMNREEYTRLVAEWITSK